MQPITNPRQLPSKTVTFGDDARLGILKGAQIVYEAVKTTYSPLSGNVAIESQFNEKHIITHDGVTVARAITLQNPVENIGAQMLKDASAKTNDVAGDGTSATVILAYRLLELANKRVAAGYNPMLMRRGIDLASTEAKKLIAQKALKISGDQLQQVAQISAGDSELGKLIADTISDVGETGGINVEEYQGIGVESEIVEGFYFGKGFDNFYFVNQENETVIYDNCQVLVVEERITSIAQIEGVLGQVANSDNRKLLIVGTVTGQGLRDLVLNKLKGKLEVVSVAPGVFGDQKGLHLQDIAEFTGGKVVVSGTPPSQVDDSYLGLAKNVTVKKDSTTIIATKTKATNERISKLKAAVKKESNQYRKDHMQARLAMLEGKVAIIRVGGESEAIMKERKMRIDDAVHATQAALTDGIVAGGATTFIHIADELAQFEHKLDKDTLEGFLLVVEALRWPFRVLMANAGLPADYNLPAVQKAGYGYGYNVLVASSEPINLLEEGVVDPALVLTQVVENGCAAASLALTNNATITWNDYNAPLADGVE